MMASRTKGAWTAPRSGGYSAVVSKDKKRSWTLRDTLTGRFTKPAPPKGPAAAGVNDRDART